MFKKKPLKTIQRCLLVAFFLTFSMITALTSHANTISSFNTKDMSTQLDAVNQAILKKNLDYEALTQVMHGMNALQKNILLCIENSQKRLDKINQLVSEIERSKAVQNNTQAYTYLLKEKNKQLTQVVSCNFYNYRLGEIREIASDEINKTNQSKLLQQVPDWGQFNSNLLSVYWNAHTLYDHSGLQHINMAQLSFLMLAIIIGFIIGFVLKKTNGSMTSGVDRISRQYIHYLIPLSFACLYCNIIFLPIQPSALILLITNALAIYAVILFMTSYAFTLDRQTNRWLLVLTGFQAILFAASNLYVVVVQYYLFNNLSFSLQLINYIDVTYILVIVRFMIAYMAYPLDWFSSNPSINMKRRIFVISTATLLCYIVFIVLNTQVLPSSLLTVIDTIYLTLLNIAYLFIIPPFLNHYIDIKYRKMANVLLNIGCVIAIVVAWQGYHYLSLTLILNSLITAGVCVIILDVNKLLSQIYFFLSDPSQVWSQKFRRILGIKTEKKLIELFTIRIILTIPIVLIGTFSMLELWGVTRYDISNILIVIHKGVSLMDTTIRPSMVLRAVSIFCLIVLSGRALATYLVRKNVVSDEKHTQVMLFSVIQYLSYMLGILIALYITGFNLRSLLVVAGALSVGLGFGLQSFVRDFISGLVIMVNKPIKIGDHIEVGDRNKSEGFIKKIGPLSTQLHTLCHSDVIIPNSEIITKVITNFTFHSNVLSRIHITINLNKNSDFALAKQLLLDIAAQNPHVIQKPPYEPVVLFELYDLNLWCVIDDVNKKEFILSELNFAIGYAFKDLLTDKVEKKDPLY